MNFNLGYNITFHLNSSLENKKRKLSLIFNSSPQKNTFYERNRLKRQFPNLRIEVITQHSLRGLHGPFIFDHYILKQITDDHKRELIQLRAEIAALKRKPKYKITNHSYFKWAIECLNKGLGHMKKQNYGYAMENIETAIRNLEDLKKFEVGL